MASRSRSARIPTPCPARYVVPGVDVAPNGPTMVDLLAEFPARQAVMMARNPLPILGPRQPSRPPNTPDDPDRVEIRVTTEAPGLLVVADTWMPGWTAEVDGRPVALFRGNRGQRVVVLVASGHTGSSCATRLRDGRWGEGSPSRRSRPGQSSRSS